MDSAIYEKIFVFNEKNSKLLEKQANIKTKIMTERGKQENLDEQQQYLAGLQKEYQETWIDLLILQCECQEMIKSIYQQCTENDSILMVCEGYIAAWIQEEEMLKKVGWQQRVSVLKTLSKANKFYFNHYVSSGRNKDYNGFLKEVKMQDPARVKSIPFFEEL